MESVVIRQRLRPIRYAFMVAEGDVSSALRAASLNAALWGGIYNPIVLMNPVENRDELLSAFDPDILVNLTGADLPGDLSRNYGKRVIEPGGLVRWNERTSQNEWALGFNILPLLRDVHEREVRFSANPTRAAIAVTSEARDWSAFLAFSYGSYGWLPQTNVEFEQAFRHSLRARNIEFSELTPLTDREALSPLGFTSHGLRLLGGRGSVSSHVVFIGDHRSAADLVAFWNIRAAGRSVVFVPAVAHRAYEAAIRIVADEGRYPISQSFVNHVDLQKAPSLSDAAFAEVRDWATTRGFELLTRDWQPRFGPQGFQFGREVEVAEIEVAEIEGIAGEETGILNDGQMTPFKLIRPPYRDDESTWNVEPSWAVELTVSGGSRDQDVMLTLPNESSAEAIACQSVIGMSGQVRLCRRGIVLLENRVRSNLQIIPARTADVFRALFEQAGIESEPSEPGRYTEQIVKTMRSLHGGCRVFKLQGVREVLDFLGGGRTLTQGNICQRVMSRAVEDNNPNWRPELYDGLVLCRGQKRPLDFTAVFNVLLDERIIRPGFTLKCRKCFKEDWYHVSEFAEDYTCRFCFTRQRVNFATKREWQYKADGLFRIPDSAQGSVAVILSLWRFEHLAHLSSGRFMTSQNVHTRDTGLRCEIDYAYLMVDAFSTAYDLVLGQANRFGDFTDEDMQNMADLADRFSRKPYLAFSTLKESFSDADKTRLRGLAERGYPVIAFTREELDRYDLFDRFDRAPHKYAVGLKEMSENTLHLNVG